MAPPGTPTNPAQLGSSPCLLWGRRGGAGRACGLKGKGLWEMQLGGEQRCEQGPLVQRFTTTCTQ